MSRAVGIDLGTTYSSVAVMRPEGRPVLLTSAEGGLLTPSVVLFTDTGEVLVGATAKNASRAMPDRFVEFVKRYMGEPHWRFADPTNREYTAQEISAFIVRRLADDASREIDERVSDAVITVPAYFDDARRKATREAGEIAGLRVLRLINEPTAAAIAFGLDANASGTILVYDLGGGTFDVTLLRAAAGEFEVIGTDGDRNLGGFDFDNALMRRVAEHIRATGGPNVLEDPIAVSDLRSRCEEAKRRLTVSDEAPIYLTVGSDTWQMTITRPEFDDLTKDLLYRTKVTLAGVLDDAGMTWTDIDHLLLVGGSTRMRMVREMIEGASGGKRPVAGINPDEAVSLGAAAVAESASATNSGARALVKVTIRDVTSHSLGVTVTEPDGQVLRNSVIIPRNTRIPIKKEDVYYTLERNQRLVDVEVTECGDVSDETDLTYVTILGTTPIRLTPGLPKDSPLKVIMAYDIDGIIHVEVIDLTNNVPLGDFELQRPNSLSPAQVSRMRAALSTRTIR